MKHLLTISVIALIALGCSKSPQEKQIQFLTDAVEALNQLQFDAAQLAQQKLAELDPSSPLPRFVAGLIFERQLQHFDALDIYITLTNSNPSFADAHAGAWRVYTRLNLMPEALREADEYRKLLPQDGDAAMILAVAFIDNDLPKRAHPFLDSAVAEGADPGQAAMIHARAYMLEDRPDMADSAYEAGLTLAKNSPQVFADAVRYLEAAGLVDSAVVISRKAISLSKDNPVQLARHFDVALRNHYFFEADQVLDRLRSLEMPDATYAMYEAFRYDAANVLTSARLAMDKVIGLTGGTLSTRMYETDIKIKASDEMALLSNFQILSQMLVDGKHDLEFQDLMAYLMALQAGKYMPGSQALPQLETVQPKYKNRPDLSSVRAQAIIGTGQVEPFNDAVEAITMGHSGQPDWITGLADVYASRDMREWEKAAATYARALEIDPWYQPAILNWANMYRALDRHDDAAKLFDSYPHFSERYPTIAMFEGICRLDAGQYEQGVDVYLMNAPMARGDERRHLQFFDALRRRWNTTGMSRFAEWLVEQGKENAHLLSLAAALRLDLHDYQAAGTLADEVLKISPNLLDAKTHKARALYGQGAVDDAIAMLKSTLETNQYHVASNYWLSRILAAEGRDPQMAQDLARRALFDSNQGLREWVNLAYVYEKTGRYDLARGESLKLTRSFGGEPEPLFRLGMAFYMENDHEQARLRLQEAIDHGLVGDDLAEARSVLAKLKS